MKKLSVLVAVLALVPAAAFAADDVNIESSEPVVRGQGWSMLAGRTIGEGQTALSVQAGWPGLTAGLLYGATNRVDVGVRFSFNYGFEGMVNFVEPGVKLQGVVRLSLVEKSKFNLGLEFAPGPLIYFSNYYYYGPSTIVGLALPFSLQLGVPVGSAIMLHGALDFPMFATFGSYGRLWFPILIGGGVEYFIDKSLAATFNVRMGPSIDTSDYSRRGNNAWFDLQALIGIEYRL